MTPPPPKRVIFVVDDDEAVRLGLSALLMAKGFAVESFPSAEAFLTALRPETAGVLLVDVRMPGMSGLDLQRELTRRGARIPVVVITGHGDVPMAVAALKAGAVDFLEKPFDSDAILAGVEEAWRRLETAITGADTADTAAAAGDPAERAALAERVAQLTPREREVMDLVVAGQPNKIIAHRLGIALRTVEIHRSRVMEKTGARNLSELIRMTIRLGGAP
jgi:two-component system response regulator FixJ